MIWYFDGATSLEGFVNICDYMALLALVYGANCSGGGGWLVTFFLDNTVGLCSLQTYLNKNGIPAVKPQCCSRVLMLLDER